MDASEVTSTWVLSLTCSALGVDGASLEMVSVDVMAGGESPISLLQPPANLPRRPICFSSWRALQLRSARDGQASIYTAAAIDQ